MALVLGSKVVSKKGRISSDRSTGSSLLHIINESCYIRMYIVVFIFQNMIMFIQEEEGYLSQIDK